jgi:hypothetical protein
MKRLALLLVPFMIQLPAEARQVNVYDECKRYIIEEEYIPGYYTNTGSYRSGQVRKTRKQVPCNGGGYATQHAPQHHHPQQGTCTRNENIFHGLLGGGIAAMVSKKDAYLWSIPLGVVSGVAVSKMDC